MIPNNQKDALFDELEKLAVSRWRSMAQKGLGAARDALDRSGIPKAWQNIRKTVQENLPKGPQTGVAGKVNTTVRDFHKGNVDRLKSVKDSLVETIE